MTKISIFAAIIVIIIFLNLSDASGGINEKSEMSFSRTFDLLALDINKSYSYPGGKLLTSKAFKTKEIIINISAEECELLKFGERDYLKVGNLTPYTKPGDPQLPMKTFVVKLPKNSEVTGISAVSGDYNEILNELNIIPTPQPRKLIANENVNKNKEIYNSNIYNSNSYFPGKVFSYDAGEDNKNKYILIRFYPMQYIPREKKAILITNAKIEIHYRSKDKLSLSLQSTEAIIITPQELKAQADNLAAFHNNTGTPTTVVTTQYIMNNYNAAPEPVYEGYRDSFLPGRNNITNYNYTLARKIISFLNQSNDVEYVILFGNARLVPPSYYIYDERLDCGRCDREECVIDYYNSWVPTDYFYGSPDYDLIPNYMVGRIPVNNTSEASHFVQKINNWSSNLNWNWFKNVAVAGGRPFLDTRCGSGRYDETFTGEIESVNIVNEGYLSGMNVTKLFRTDNSFNKSNVENVLSGNYGIIYHMDHGSGDRLLAGVDSINTTDIMALGNNPKVPIVVSASCMNGAYDTHLMPNNYYGYTQPMSIGESILKSDAGGISYVGGSRTNYAMDIAYLKEGYVQTMKESYMPELLANIFEIYHDGGDSLGNLTKSSIFQYVIDNEFSDNPTNKRTLFEFVLLGDPALKIPVQQSGEYGVKPKLSVMGPQGDKDSHFSHLYGNMPTYPSGSTVTVTCQASSSTVKMKLIAVDEWFNETIDVRDVEVINDNATYTFTVTDKHLYLVRCIDNNNKEGWLYVNQPFAVFTDSYSTQANDVDSDGKYDYLSVNVGVNVKKSGEYTIEGYLHNGIYWILASSTVNLTSGIRTVKLNFDGHDIYKLKMSGNYRLMHLGIKDYQNMQIDYKYNPYSTPSYAYTQFEPEVSKTAYLAGSYSESVVDVNGNGKKDYLTISMNVNVNKAGDYGLYGELYDNQDNFIGWTENSFYLNEGTQAVKLDFGGQEINYNKANGNYKLMYLFLYDENWNEIDFEENPYTTNYHSYNDFEAFKNIFTGTYSSLAVDTNGNNIKEYLTVNVGVNIPSDGYYYISASLQDSKRNKIDSASTGKYYIYLTSGVQTIQLNFTGWKIYSNGVNGPYKVINLRIKNENSTLDYESNPHNTSSSYTYASFESQPWKILLVDDDLGYHNENTYKTALDVNGYTYKYWDVNSGGYPGSLSSYDVVIWFTGGDYETTLTSTDQTNLKNYLNAGGKLFISGQNIGYDLTNDGTAFNDFYRNYLHANYIYYDADTGEITGIYGDFISDGLDVNQYGYYPDVISVRGDAVKIFNYVGGLYPSYPAGLRYSGKYRVVYLPFCFEFASRTYPLMDRTVKWLLQPTTFKSYASYGEDTDGDNLHNYLVINVTLNVSKPGNYSIGGGLFDPNLNNIDYSESKRYLNSGTHTVQLKFDGYKIYNNAVSGNYKLRSVYIENSDSYNDYPLDYAISPYTTPYYSYTSFDRAFTGNYEESTENIYEEEGNLYKYLTINVSVNIDVAGHYIVSGELYDNNELFITKTGNLTYLNRGVQEVELNFRGFDIYQNEADGNYYLENLYVKDIKRNILDYNGIAYTTLSYNHENFKLNCLDDDNDGYNGTTSECPIGTDCDDNNASINPGAEVYCNGFDENCNGFDDCVCIDMSDRN